MDHPYLPTAQIQPIPIMEDEPGHAPEDLIIVYAKSRREITGHLCQAVFDRIQRKGKLSRDPTLFRFMDGKTFEMTQPADMIPVSVGQCDLNRQGCQPIHNRPDVGNS